MHMTGLIDWFIRSEKNFRPKMSTMENNIEKVRELLGKISNATFVF